MDGRGVQRSAVSSTGAKVAQDVARSDGPVEARFDARAGASTPECIFRPAKPAVPKRLSAARPMGLAPGSGRGRPCRQYADGVVRAVRRGRVRSADLLREPRKFAAGALGRTSARDSSAARAGRWKSATDRTVACREHFTLSRLGRRRVEYRCTNENVAVET